MHVNIYKVIKYFLVSISKFCKNLVIINYSKHGKGKNEYVPSITAKSRGTIV